MNCKKQRLWINVICVILVMLSVFAVILSYIHRCDNADCILCTLIETSLKSIVFLAVNISFGMLKNEKKTFEMSKSIDDISCLYNLVALKVKLSD